jgi:hypothetical protein
MVWKRAFAAKLGTALHTMRQMLVRMECRRLYAMSPSTNVWLSFCVPAAMGVIFVIFYSRAARRHALEVIEEWAREQRYTLLSIRQPTFVPLWKSGKGWQFFRVTLKDTSGETKKCWLRCQDFNAKPSRVEVTWI